MLSTVTLSDVEPGSKITMDPEDGGPAGVQLAPSLHRFVALPLVQVKVVAKSQLSLLPRSDELEATMVKPGLAFDELTST